MANDKILDAVKKLDPNNDNHWTADGLPRIDTVRMLASDTSLTREQVDKIAPAFNREAARGTPAAPAAPPVPAVPPVAPTPVAGDPPAGATPPPLDSGVRGDLGPETPAPPAPPAGSLDQTGGPVPPENVDGEKLPQPDPLPTAPAADGLPTALEPTRVEGARPEGLTVDDVSTPADSIEAVSKPNTHKEDVRDALATVAPSPNAPTTLGGPLEPGEVKGINVDGLSAAADATGEAQLPSLDRGYPGDPDAIPSLEAALAQATERSNKLRGQHDKLTAQLNEAATEESRLRAAIEAATPRTGHMQAIQGYFEAQNKRAEEQVMLRQTIVESGVDLTKLGRLTQRSALDASRQAPKSS
jgi:hypothetical protein